MAKPQNTTIAFRILVSEIAAITVTIPMVAQVHPPSIKTERIAAIIAALRFEAASSAETLG